MSQKIQVLLVCDLHDDDTEGSETVAFSLDGSAYEIDLCASHAAKLRDSVATYVGGGRKAGSSAARRTTGRRATATADKRDLGPVREWARGQGLKVSDRGRVSQEVLDKYDAAH